MGRKWLASSSEENVVNFRLESAVVLGENSNIGLGSLLGLLAKIKVYDKLGGLVV